MLRIGITGGIGSGKTTVSKIFEVLGTPVYYADEAAKRLMNSDEALHKELVKHFGTEIYDEGQLNRKKLSALVFNDADKLALLNSIVHPLTIADAENWMKQVALSGTDHPAYAIKEAALIFESGAQKKLDYVIGVNAPYQLRVQRAMNRDQLSREEVESRINRQMDETKKMNLCDFIITNDEEQLLIPQVEELHRKLVELSL